jgi:hypothetical protein
VENIKLQNYKIMRYGKIALQVRRGLISADEAEHYYWEAERDYLTLVAACQNDTVRQIIENGLPN